ncbi:MAG: Hsp20/alpha crystallin family protein [Anaerolineaceae bacterium]
MPTTVSRWDPTSEFNTMRNLMDRFFDQGRGRLPFRNGEDLGPSSLALDVIETGDQFVVKAAVPGIDPANVDISVEDDVLSIKGEFQQEEETSEDNYLRRELRFGNFQRTLRLPPTVDAEHAQAKFENGVLTLTLPKKPEARARSIKITTNGVIDEHAEQVPNSQN